VNVPANFIDDTAVSPTAESGIYSASLSPDWAVWGPNGGYLAAIALRAGMAESRLPRPASFQCHFLASGEFGPVQLRVSSLGGGKRAESLRVDLVQGDRLLLAATCWMVDDGLKGFEHDVGDAPGVPGPGSLPSYQDRAEDYANWYPIWRSIEGRPVKWDEPPGDPVWHAWLRFTGTPIADRSADALRQLFWLDMPAWNAICSAHPWPYPFLTPNLDLTVQFHRFAPEADWMLAEGTVLLAGEGLVGCVSRVWTEDGRLLATGTSKNTCRPNPGYAEELERARALQPKGD
jgi:acyl-CoA thioesterase